MTFGRLVDEKLQAVQFRLPILAIVTAACSFATLLYLGRRLDFVYEDWQLLLSRQGWDRAAFLTPYHEHLVAAPLLLIKLLYVAVGIHSYLPYLAVLLAFHSIGSLAIYWLVRPWNEAVALISMVVLLFFGPGALAFLYSTATYHTVAVAAGLCALLAVRSPASRRRYALGLFALTVSVLSSLIGVFYLVAASVDCLMRRKPFDAVVTLAPLLGLLVWHFRYANAPFEHAPNLFSALGFGSTLAIQLIGEALGAAEPLWLWASIGIVVAVGVAWRRSSEVARASIGPLSGLVVGLLGLGVGRSEVTIESSAYLYILLPLLLLVLGPAVSVLVPQRRWPLLLLALVPIAINAETVGAFAADETNIVKRQDTMLSAIRWFAAQPGVSLDNVPASPILWPELTPARYLALIRQYGDEGLVPQFRTLTDRDVSDVDLVARAMIRAPLPPVGSQRLNCRAAPVGDFSAPSRSVLELTSPGVTQAVIYIWLSGQPPVEPSAKLTVEPNQVAAVALPDAGPHFTWHVRIVSSNAGAASICQ